MAGHPQDSLRAYLKDIANSIRFIQDSSDPLPARSAPAAIRSLDTSSGGVLVENFTVNNFPDLDRFFIEGDEIDYSDVTASILLDNGFSYNLANDQLTFTPSDVMTVDDTLATVSFDWGDQHLVYSQSITVHAYTDLDAILAAIPNTMEECSWGMIKALSMAGALTSYFPVGSTKTEVLSDDNAKSGGMNVRFVLIGYDHNKELESPDGHAAHFMLNYNPDAKKVYNQNLGYTGNAPNEYFFCMNFSNKNTGGWESSTMRNVVFDHQNEQILSNPNPNTFTASLPRSLRARMRSVTKYSDNVCGGTGSLETSVTGTQDYIALMSEFEFMGYTQYSNSYEAQKQLRYDFFGSDKVSPLYIYSNSACTTIGTAWTRSGQKDTDYSFCMMKRGPATNPAKTVEGIMPIIFL